VFSAIARGQDQIRGNSDCNIIERIVHHNNRREVGYGLSLEESSAANLAKSIQAATERVAPKAEVA
jgi:hypothetical protein